MQIERNCSLSEASGGYTPLTAEIYQLILAGSIRL